MSDFEQDSRRRQELSGRPIADAIYGRVLRCTSITRSEDWGEKWAHLDRIFGIDAHVRLPDGQALTVQEKFLSHREARFNSLTVEYMQDAETEERGDWFRLLAQAYFIAYFNEAGDGFCKWALVDVLRLKTETNLGNVAWHDNRNKDGRARASFRWCDVARIPRLCVICQQGFFR